MDRGLSRKHSPAPSNALRLCTFGVEVQELPYGCGRRHQRRSARHVAPLRFLLDIQPNVKEAVLISKALPTLLAKLCVCKVRFMKGRLSSSLFRPGRGMLAIPFRGTFRFLVALCRTALQSIRSGLRAVQLAPRQAFALILLKTPRSEQENDCVAHIGVVATRGDEAASMRAAVF